MAAGCSGWRSSWGNQMAAEELVNQTYSERRDAPPPRTFMGGMRMTSRVSLFVFLGLLAIVAMGALFYVADQRLTSAINGLASAERITALVARIDSASRGATQSSRRFLTEQSDALEKEYDRNYQAALAALKNLRGRPLARNSIRTIDNLTRGLDQHVTHFKNIIRIQALLGADANSGLAGNARASGAALENRITSTGSARLIRQATELRDIENALRSGVSPDDPQNIKVAIAALRQVLSATNISSAAKLSVTQAINSYATDIEQLARTRLTQASEISKISEINAYLLPNLGSLVKFSDELARNMTQKADDSHIFSRRILAGGGAAVMIALILIGTMMLRSMATPIVLLSGAANRMARGENLSSIPALGNRDETGDLANALIYFRENMLQADRIREELENHLQQVEKKTEQDAVAQAGETNLRDADQQIQIDEDEAAAPTEAPPKLPLPGAPSRELVPLPPEPESKSKLSDVSQLVSASSQSASDAARDAERADIMVTGVSESLEKIEEIELLLASISDQMSLLAVQTALSDDGDPDDPENLVLLSEKRMGEDAPQRPVGQSVGDRIETIQSGTKRAIKAIQQIGRTLTEVNSVAVQFAAEASDEALKAATALLHQSEDLRGMLDDLLGRIKSDDQADSK